MRLLHSFSSELGERVVFRAGEQPPKPLPAQVQAKVTQLLRCHNVFGTADDLGMIATVLQTAQKQGHDILTTLTSAPQPSPPHSH